MASWSLSAYGVGLLGHMLVKVLAPGYFSRQDTATPVRYGIVALVSNMVLNLLLIWQLKHAGLALATSLSAFINAGLLWYGLRRAGVFAATGGWTRFLGQIIVANAGMCAVLIVLTPEQQMWFDMAFWERFGAMLLICAGGAVTYGAFLLLSGFRFGQMVR